MQSSKDHDDFSDRKFRETLNITIINNFLDFHNGSDYSTLSSFFNHMRNSFKEIPHIFVSSYVPDYREAFSNSELEEARQRNESLISAAFTEWLMMWLLRVLRYDCVSSVHKECKDLFVSLLHLVRSYKPTNFRLYILRLMKLLTDLNEFIDKFEESGEGEFHIKNYFHSEKLLICEDSQDKELVLVDISITFTNPDECESLQEKITSLLDMLTVDITQFLSDELNNLSKIYCIQIEVGNLPVKCESLKALSSLIKYHSLMFTVSQVNYIFSCLEAVIEYCCVCPEQDSNIVSLEKATAECLLALADNVGKPENKVFLNSYLVAKFSLNLFQTPTKPKFLDMSEEFQFSFVKCSITFIEYGFKNYCSIPANTLHNFTQLLHNLFFKSRNPKFLVPLFVYLITSNQKSLKRKQECVESSSKLEKSTSGVTFEGMIEHSQTWASLYNSLFEYLHETRGEKLIRIETINACIEILVLSFTEIALKDKNNFHMVLSKKEASIERKISDNLLELINHQVRNHLIVRFSTQAFEEILHLYSILLSVQDLIYFSSEQLDIVANIISIPFILQQQCCNLLDLQSSFISAEIVRKLSLMPSSCIIKSLESLILLPCDIAPQWKHQILLFCLSNEDEALKVCAIKLLPNFFYNGLIQTQNIPDIIPYLLTESLAILVQASSIIGKICCVSADTCSFVRKQSNNSIKLTAELTCKQCEKINGDMEVPDSQPLTFNNNLEDLFLQLINHTSETVRKECIHSIVPYFTHNKISENMLQAIMQLLIDPDLVIRNKFGNIISNIVKVLMNSNKDTEWQQKVEEILIDKLKSALLISKGSGNIQLQRTVVYSIGEIGKVADNGLLLITVISLLESYMTSVPSLKVVAFMKLKEIAESKAFKMSDLFKAYKDPICKFVTEFLLASPFRSTTDILLVLQDIRTVFGFNDLESFINQTQRFILPYIVSKSENEATPFLESLSSVLQIDKSDLLINNFPYIFSHFVRHCTTSKSERALLSIQKWTNLELGSLLRCHYQLIHNELLLHLSTHYEQVFNGLATLALKSGKETGARIILTEDMANYLQPKLLGFLVFFDAQMLKSSIEDKKLALESLVSIMQLMGPRAVTAVRFKLMATLRIALRFKEGNFPQICCKAWNTFVHSIEVPYLGPLLNQIIVALLPLLELEPISVSEIFQYLIIENRAYLSDYFHDLYFVPETSELQDINAVLKEYSESPSSITDFHALLFHSLKGISHENLEVRLHALEKLKQVLQANQSAIYEHLLARENVDNLLSNLIAALISGCRESDSRVRIALGECLGSLGAIDPGRLDTKTSSTKETLNKFYSGIDDEDFAFALIQELVHSFLAADECSIQTNKRFATLVCICIGKITVRKLSEGSICVGLNAKNTVMEGTSTSIENSCSEKEQKGKITNALKYCETLLQNDNLLTNSPLDDISCVSIAMSDEFHYSILKILEDRQIIEADELILNEEYKLKEFTKDCSACAIQEVLRFYKCSNEKGSSGSQLWKRFPPDIQEILAVLFHSQYKPIERSRKKFPSPIYKSKIGSTYRDWTKHWFYSLLQKVKNEHPSKLFHCCSIIVKYDLNSTLFLLPHLVVYALIDATDSESEEICSEILAVLNHSMESSSSSDLLHLSSQTVFSVFDHLTKWSNEKRQEMINASTRAAAKKTEPGKDLIAISNCLKKIPQILLAKASFSCKAYTRSLMHLEQHLKEHPDELEDNISFIQKLYSALDEPDGVAGVAAVRKGEASLRDLILENEAIGDMQGAFACYEKAIKLYPDEVNYYGGLLKCFLGMDQPTTAVSYANGVLNEKPEWKEKLNQYRVEAAWKLADWQDLENFLQDQIKDTEWTVAVGNILYHANKKDMPGVERIVKMIRGNQMAPLSAASMEKGSYLRGYEHLTRMHMLTDLELCIHAIFNLDKVDVMSDDQNSLFKFIIPMLNARRLLVQSSLRYQEPIHDLHRVLLKIGREKFPSYSEQFNQEIASCWLQSAKLARKSGFYQRAYSCLLEAGNVNTADCFMEKTKWHWNKGEKEQAIYCLKKGISEHFSSTTASDLQGSKITASQQLMCAKAKLLLAVYSEETSIVESNTLINMYKEVVNLQPNWEASHFHLAKYYDKVLNSCEEPAARAEIMVNIVNNFRISLKHGCKNIYHSLPRLLDIWFDLGTLLTQDIHTLSKKYPNSWRSMTTCLDQISSMIVEDLCETVPLYLFLTAFPQMVSRICHSHPSISLHLQKFISRILASYSQQAMWMMMAVSKSSHATRIKRCKQIFQEAILLSPALAKFISDIIRLADKLIELSNKNVGDTSSLSLCENFPSLIKLIEERSFSPILLPTQYQMIVTLPTGFSCSSDHNPFPFSPVYFKSFANTVEVFNSLQKPKKLTVIGSDGKLYPMMCKPKDDLRKDCRLMEFNNLVNRYLKSDPEARRRQLYIRTYTVVPLNEECGLIEWVPNLNGLRNILSRMYKLKGIFVNGREIRAIMPAKTATFDQKLHIFKTKFLPRFPPVFHDWFLITFPDPTAWYLARLAYARTTAVMSMVGYIVGLGDRHGENILFDASCGDTVHVDLNCLFNKGETMECPEVVPFRLTHNMVSAMGPTGYEGAFRKACEVTMRVMRSKTDALMSVLRPFVHDPLLEWKGHKNAKSQQGDSGEITNAQALTHVKDIELRLNGIIKTKRKQQGLPLSIEGQVNHLILEATDILNLSQMYIGWAAYM